MVYCTSCNTSCKKIALGDMCKHCANELCGTPPGPNSTLMQYEKLRKERERVQSARNKSTNKVHFSLLDVVASTIIEDDNLVLQLANLLPEGHPPWYTLLRAWYIKKKQKCKGKKDEKYPMQRLLKVMKITTQHF